MRETNSIIPATQTKQLLSTQPASLQSTSILSTSLTAPHAANCLTTTTQPRLPSGGLLNNDNIQSFDDDDNEWELGVGNLIIDLDADLERNSTSPISGRRTSGTDVLVAGQPVSAMEHQVTVDKGLKMKIKRKNVGGGGGGGGARTELNKHEIMKQERMQAEKDANKSPIDNKAPKGRTVHKKDKKDKTKETGSNNGVSNGFPHTSCVNDAGVSSGAPTLNHNAPGAAFTTTSVKKEAADPYEFNAKVEDRISVPVKKIKAERGPTPPSSPPSKPNPFSVPEPQPAPPAMAHGPLLTHAPVLHGPAVTHGPIVRRDASTETQDSSTITEPECLGPCEPGTSVNLEGIVWQETENGVLVVNVTWRGKTYVGTLLDATRHDWAPPRFNCDSPTDELDNRTPKGRAKRGVRGSVSTPVENVIETRKLRKGRRGGPARNFQAPPSPAKSDITPVGSVKRKTRPNELELVTDDKGKRCRSSSRGTPTSAGPTLEPNAQGYIECPEANCNKKYKHINGLRYHQSHAHSNNDDKDSASKNSSESSESRPPTPSTPSGENKTKRTKVSKDAKTVEVKTETDSANKDSVTETTTSNDVTPSAVEKKKADKIEKVKVKPGVNRPIVPAPQVVLTSGAVVNSSAAGANASPLSPLAAGLKPIQPKPTVMGEPSTVNPALVGLKEKKNKHKKKSKDKDREKERSKSPKGAKEDSDNKTVIPVQKSEADVEKPKTPAPAESTDSIADSVHSPAYSDISDANESAPSMDTDADKNKNTKPSEPVPVETPKDSQPSFNLYPYYGQPPYLVPTVANKTRSPQNSPSTQSKVVESAPPPLEPKIEKVDKLTNDVKETVETPKEVEKPEVTKPITSTSQPQSLYSPGQQSHLPVLTAYGYIDPAYHMHLMSSDHRYRDQHEKFLDEQKRFRKEQQGKSGQVRPSSSVPEGVKSPAPQYSPQVPADQNKNVPKIGQEPNPMRERTDSQVKQSAPEMKPQETRIKSEPYDSLLERQQEDLKRYYLYQQQKHQDLRPEDLQKRHEEDRRAVLEIKQEPKSIVEHRPEPRMDRPKDCSLMKEPPTTPKPDLKRSATPQDKIRDQREVQEKRARMDSVSPHTHPTPKSSKPSTPTLIPTYSQFVGPPAFIQGPYGQHVVPFDQHGPYRGVNPMLGQPGPMLGYPGPHAAAYMHPAAALRYHVSPMEKEKQLMMSPGARHPGLPEAPKALDLLQQHASHYYNTAQQHKIHELEKAGRPESATPPSKPRTNSSPVPMSLQKPKDLLHPSSRQISPPPQRHVHTHHHTHLVGGYPMYDPYGAIINPNQAPPSSNIPPTSINPFPPK